MKLKLIVVLLLLTIRTIAQQASIEILENAVAGVNTYNSLPVYGKTSSGSLYGAGLNLLYDENNKPLPAEFVRIDFGTKSVTYKTMPEIISGNGAFWAAAIDDKGNFFASFNAPVRKVVLFNLKDSIHYQDLGNPFQDGQSWAYSMSLGRDGKMYFGGSGKTYWSSYDPETSRFEKHPAIDPGNDYLLSIAADEDYVYAQTGQRNSVQLWSVRKKDDNKKLLLKITNTSRISLDSKEDGIYASVNVDTLRATFRLIDGDTVRLNRPSSSKKMSFEEVNNDKGREITAAYDQGKNKLFFSIPGNGPDSLDIRSSSTSVAVKKIFSFPKDTKSIYFIGDYYGNFFRYDLKSGKNYLLGSTGFNIYSSLALNDSIMYLGGYPNGVLMEWNKNKPWTTKRLIGEKIVAPTDANANPRVMGYWKSQGKPPAGFHHTLQLMFDPFNNIVGAGNVIRIGNAASLGVYKREDKTMYGLDYEPYTKMGYNNIIKWKDKIIYSMNNSGSKPKLYFYSSKQNAMVDSIDLDYDDYGKIYVQGNILYGIANDRVYKLNLPKRKVLAERSFPKNSITNVLFLSNGRAIANTKVSIPGSIVQVTSMNYQSYWEANGYVYAFNGKNIIRLKGLIKK